LDLPAIVRIIEHAVVLQWRPNTNISDAEAQDRAWIVNGWQSYGKFNKAPGFGLQVLYRPTGWLSILGNQYFGTDTLGVPGRKRFHTDDSVQIKYYDRPNNFLSKAAMTVTVDAGCEFGENSGVSCSGGIARTVAILSGIHGVSTILVPQGSLRGHVGRWRHQQSRPLFGTAATINGATAFSGTPYFTASPGDPYKSLGCVGDVRLHAEAIHHVEIRIQPPCRERPILLRKRWITPPGGNIGPPGSFVEGFTPDCASGKIASRSQFW